MKRDSLITGLLAGLILPLVGFYLYYFIFFRYMTFVEFTNHLIKTGLFVSVLSLGVILNLVSFFIFYRIEADQAAKGIILATFIYAFFVLYFKVII